MVPAFVQIALLGIAAATAALPVILAIALLETGRPIANSIAYLAGGLLVYIVLVLLGGAIIFSIEDGLGWRHQVSDAAYVLITVIGALFLLIAGITWRNKQQVTVPARANALLDSISPFRSFGLGLVLCSPGLKNATLTVAALGTVAAHKLDLLPAILAMCLFLVMALAPPTAPVVTYLLLPRDRSDAVIARWKAWVEDHAGTIIVIVCAAIGILLIQEGLSGLLS